MANWAQIDENGLVTNVVVTSNSMPDEGHAWLVESLGGVWVQTSYNTHAGVYYDPETGQPAADQSKALRGNYASVGFTYDQAIDVFLPPKPHQSWIMDETTYQWIAPIPAPETGDWIWDEESGSWVEVEDEAI